MRILSTSLLSAAAAFGLLVLTSSPAFAQSNDTWAPGKVIDLAGSAVDLLDSAVDRAGKVIDPENSVIGNLNADQYLSGNDIYIKRGLLNVNELSTADINAGSVTTNQSARIDSLG